MTHSPDFDRVTTAWLADGPVQLSDRVLEVVFEEVHRTRQQRSLRTPWRFNLMPAYLRLAAGIAIAAVIGVGALTFFDRSPDVGVQPTPAPTASPSTSPAPEISDGPLAPGRYRYDGNGVRVTVTVPAGWEGGEFSVSKAPARELPDGANLGFRQPTSVILDPCAPESGARLIGPSVDDLMTDDLVTAISGLPNVTASPPGDVTISGFDGKHLSFVVDTEGIDCVMGFYGQGSFVRAADNGQRQDLWILDVAGTRLVIDAATYPETTPAVRAELQSMVDTLVIEPID